MEPNTHADVCTHAQLQKCAVLLLLIGQDDSGSARASTGPASRDITELADVDTSPSLLVVLFSVLRLSLLCRLLTTLLVILIIVVFILIFVVLVFIIIFLVATVLA